GVESALPGRWSSSRCRSWPPGTYSRLALTWVPSGSFGRGGWAVATTVTAHITTRLSRHLTGFMVSSRRGGVVRGLPVWGPLRVKNHGLAKSLDPLVRLLIEVVIALLRSRTVHTAQTTFSQRAQGGVESRWGQWKAHVILGQARSGRGRVNDVFQLGELQPAA